MCLARWMRLAIVVTVLCGGAALAFAQTLDPPAASIGEVSRVGVWMHIQAGADGAPGGFTVEWMKKSDYDLFGGWPTYADPSLLWCTFDGIPTRNPSTGSFLLPPNGAIDLEMGDVFDETGVSGNDLSELPSGEELVFRVYSEPAAGFEESAYSATLFATTTSIPAQNCTFTQGYWKTHSGAWPVASLTLGSVTYTKAQLLSILNTPAAGNGLLILAHQLIATKLNFAQGADPTAAAAAVAAADALIGGLVCPPVGAGYLTPASVNATTNTLDDYNNGSLGTPHCGSVPTTSQSWSAVKTSYR